MDYVRIGTTYYKKVRKPLVSGDTVENMMAWSVECIKQDHGKHFLSSIPRFDGFCLVPSHLAYRREIANFYNRYHPFQHQPIPGYPKKTLNFLKHVVNSWHVDPAILDVDPPAKQAINVRA